MRQDPVDDRAEDSRADSRWRVLEALRADAEGSGVQSVAEHTGLHPNTVRFHLDRLEADGLVHRQVRRDGEHGRPPLVYTAAAFPNAGGTRRDFGELAKVLAQLIEDMNPDPVRAAIESGRSWGLELTAGSPKSPSKDEAVTELVKVLDKLGFAPEVSETDEDIMVMQRHCPFLEVARDHQDVVCSVHLGLMRGLLEGLAAPVVTERLVPFAGPNGCQAYLAHAPK